MFYTYSHATPKGRIFYMVINGQRKSHKGYTWRKESLENK